MTPDEKLEAKLRDAKRRAAWTMPLEYYYPQDRPAAALRGGVKPALAPPPVSRPYTVEPVTGGCKVIRVVFSGGAGIRFRERRSEP